MKIAILSPFYPYRGGISQFSVMLYRVLEKEHVVKAFSFSKLYPDFFFPGKTQFVEEGDQALSIPSERLLNSMNPFSYQKTANAIAEFRPDVLIICYWMSFFGPAYGHIASRLKKKTKVISLLHNAIPHEPKFFDKALAKLLFNQCQGFIVMSEVVKNDLLKIKPNANYYLKSHPLYDHFGEKIAREVALTRLGLNINKKTVLFFGLIRDYKGLDLLIDSMAELDDSFQLLIAGECYGSFDKYVHQIENSPANKRIKAMNQYVEDALVPILFSAADLLVLPYKSATQSGVVSVAYHFEVPVLATDVGGLRESVEIPCTGLICKPNANSIAQGINEVFNTGTDYFIQNIRKEKKALSWDQFAKAIIQFADSI